MRRSPASTASTKAGTTPESIWGWVATVWKGWTWATATARTPPSVSPSALPGSSRSTAGWGFCWSSRGTGRISTSPRSSAWLTAASPSTSDPALLTRSATGGRRSPSGERRPRQRLPLLGDDQPFTHEAPGQPDGLLVGSQEPQADRSALLREREILHLDLFPLQKLHQIGGPLPRSERQHESAAFAAQKIPLHRPQGDHDQEQHDGNQGRFGVETGADRNADRRGDPEAGGGGQPVHRTTRLDDGPRADEANAGDDLRRDPSRVPGVAPFGEERADVDRDMGQEGGADGDQHGRAQPRPLAGPRPSL